MPLCRLWTNFGSGSSSVLIPAIGLPSSAWSTVNVPHSWTVSLLLSPRTSGGDARQSDATVSRGRSNLRIGDLPFGLIAGAAHDSTAALHRKSTRAVMKHKIVTYDFHTGKNCISMGPHNHYHSA